MNSFKRRAFAADWTFLSSFRLWPLTAEIRHNLFLAFKEALNNVVNHAAATQVDISLVIKPEGFTLTVKDNGCGFDPKLLSWKLPSGPDRLSHGNGLINMRQRLAEIGGHFDIQSEPGMGTTQYSMWW